VSRSKTPRSARTGHTREVLSARRPTPDAIRAFLADHAAIPLSYDTPAMTRGLPPAGWVMGRDWIELGSGSAVYERAAAAVDRWAMFDVPWVELFGADRPPAVDQTVAVLARVGPVWSLNGCRVTYLVDDRGAFERHGFAYGTLGEHMEVGEERFTVEGERESDRVLYDVIAFSRPRHWLARAGGPLSRRLQRRFRIDSGRAIQRALTA
jgi:uncharacterized protein (UPF0548 family)